MTLISFHDIDFLSFVHASLLADLLGQIHIKTYKIEKPKWSTTIHIVDETNRLFIKSYPGRKQRNQHRVTAIRENTSKTQIQKKPSIGLKAPHTTSSISKHHKYSISIGLKAPHNNLTYFKTTYIFVICWKSCKMLFLKFSSKVVSIHLRANLEFSGLNLNMNLMWDFWYALNSINISMWEMVIFFYF